MTEFDHLTAGGVRLRLARWPGGARRALLLTGYSEFLEKYAHVAAALVARGYSVASFDWRGQGGSDRLLADRRRGFVHRFEDHLADLAAVAAAMEAAAPDLVIGHSMGGHLALRAAAEGVLRPRRLVAVAPMLGINTRGLPLWAAKTLAYGADWLGRGSAFVPGGRGFAPEERPFANNPLTSDAETFQAMQATMRAAPHLVVGAPTYRWVRAAFDSIARLTAPGVAEAIDVAVLMTLAEDERLVDNRAARRFAARLPRCRLRLIQGARHEIMAEAAAVRARFWQEFDEFMGEDRDGAAA
ncbi:MAG: alpha/beta hydrolase [Thalassobaculales bacterium]